MPYRLSALAERDLDEIWLYVADDDSPEIADRLVDDIIDRFDLQAEQSVQACDPSRSRATSSTIVRKAMF